jgi:dTDP-4-dehydrorhamnose 3,5-epimerase
MNVSYSKKGCIRGLHYHHRQVDFWIFIQGEFRVGLHDLRPGSPTSGTSSTIDISSEDRLGLYIPIGVAHGFATKTDVVMTYLVDNYYDTTDENEVAWNDPDIGIDWGVEVTGTSERDRKAPRLKDIPKDELPR